MTRSDTWERIEATQAVALQLEEAVYEAVRPLGEPLEAGAAPPCGNFIGEPSAAVRGLLDAARLDEAAPGKIRRRFERLNCSREILDWIDAAYSSWPWFAAQYYIPGVAADDQQRGEARESLCRIQRILFANIRWTLDYLRERFSITGDEELLRYEDIGRFLNTDDERSQFHHEDLFPLCKVIGVDLCAVDSLVDDMLQLMHARPTVRRAFDVLQRAGLDRLKDVEGEAQPVAEAFQSFGVGHLNLFFHSSPEDVGRQELPLSELAHSAKLQGAASDLTLLTPFHRPGGSPQWDQDPHAEVFRELSHRIYSASREKFPNYATMRRATTRSERLDTFTPGGVITDEYLSGYANEEVTWPYWFKKDLEQLADEEGGVDKLKDLGKAWWEPCTQSELERRLCPGASPRRGELPHVNDHLSAYWDYMASPKTAANGRPQPGRFLDSEAQLFRRFGPDREERDTSFADYRLALQMMLRRDESAVRTGFFMPLGRTFDTSQLYLFASGSFIGLERPGVPFERERFEALTDYLRPLITALAHYCETRAVKTQIIDRLAYDQRTLRIFDLLAGQGMFYEKRKGCPLFHSLLRDDGKDVDHDLHSAGPSWQNVEAVFQPHWISDPTWRALRQAYEEDREAEVRSTIDLEPCAETWKALLETADKNGQEWRMDVIGGKEFEPYLSRQVYCVDCVQDAMRFLLGDARHQFNFGADDSLEAAVLPSRPGIRFLMALTRFARIVHDEGKKENGASIERLTIGKNCAVIQLRSAGKLLPQLLKVRARPNKRRSGKVRNAFAALIHCQPFDKHKSDHIDWHKLLMERALAAPLTVRIHEDSEQIELLWHG